MAADILTFCYAHYCELWWTITNFGVRIYESGFVFSQLFQSIENLITYHGRDLNHHYNNWFGFGEALGKIIQIGVGIEPANL